MSNKSVVLRNHLKHYQIEKKKKGIVSLEARNIVSDTTAQLMRERKVWLGADCSTSETWERFSPRKEEKYHWESSLPNFLQYFP